MDLIRWKQELIEDRNRLATLHAAAAKVDASRDAKLTALREMIDQKCRNPINPGNRKVIVFTAFADTARYLYDQLAPWAKTTLDIDTALVTGTGSNQTTIAGLRKDLSSILATFAPKAKERPDEFANEGDLNLLIATDCISEGQNLQDCDWLINYDIHWKPGPHHPALRPHRSHRLAQRAHSARQFLAEHGTGGVHQAGTAGQRPHGAARHLRHRRREPD